jgi:hypothetical protein
VSEEKLMEKSTDGTTTALEVPTFLEPMKPEGVSVIYDSGAQANYMFGSPISGIDWMKLAIKEVKRMQDHGVLSI